jgi:pyridoxal phosphate enzyme (YggS family)
VLERNLAAVRERIARAASAAGRDPAGVRLLAVTKYVGPALARGLVELGLADLGESRVQSLERKVEALGRDPEGPRWHLIGHLQRNKARRAAALAATVHSIDSPRVLAALERAAAEAGTRPRVYLEVLLAEGDGERTGLAPDALEQVLRDARALEHLRPVGLMTMGPVPAEGDDATERQAPARRVFARLAALRDELAARHAGVFEDGRIELSMGMSSDLEAAVACGSNVVRVGSALFEGIDLAAAEAPEG